METILEKLALAAVSFLAGVGTTSLYWRARGYDLVRRRHRHE